MNPVCGPSKGDTRYCTYIHSEPLLGLDGEGCAERRAECVGHVVQTLSHVGLTDEAAACAVALLREQQASKEV